jgi:transcriptional regulatory protein RtcR
MDRKTVVIGLLGTRLDAGVKPTRWQRWRPTVALCQHEDLLVHRLELLYDPQHLALAEQVAGDVRQISPETEVSLRALALPDPWDFEGVFAHLHDFARIYPFNTDAEDYLIHITTGSHVAQICLFLLTESRHLPGRLLQTSPPRRRGHRTDKACGSYRTIDLDLSRYDQLASRFRRERLEGAAFLKDGIETRNASFNHLIEQITRVVEVSRAPILLTGPTGAGKSQLARRLFALKKARRLVDGAFVEVNCATLRGDAAMSAIFGHVRGAFTGAVKDREGLMRAAHGGVLFLDEIGELGLDEQAMLLRAIETGRFMPVGADREVESDFQLIAGTNRDLVSQVGEGRFREDLLARIDLWTFRLPGLRERVEDIGPNLEFELERYAERSGSRVSFSREAREQFLAFSASPAAAWSGNFRDLNAAVTRMATLAAGGRITESLVLEEQRRLERRWRGARPGGGDEALLAEVLTPEQIAEIDRFDRVQLAEVVRVCRASDTASEAGRTLFAASRARRRTVNDADRIRKYLARWALSFGDVKGGG